jgi:hypothetical protein
VRGKWTYLYRAVDKRGDTIDFYLSPLEGEVTRDGKHYVCTPSSVQVKLLS